MSFKTSLLLLLAATHAISGSPTPVSAEHRSTVKTLQPSALVIHNLDTGNTCNQYGGLISEQNGRQLISTLFTFTYPADAAGKTCYLGLPLGASANISGLQKTDVFRMWAPVNSCPSSSNNRDVELGRLNLVANGEATWDWTSSNYLTHPTACPAPGTVEGIELAPVWASNGHDWLAWVQGQDSGLRVYYY